MAFDLATFGVSWLLGRSLNKVADKASEALFPDAAAQKRMNADISLWMGALPDELDVGHPDALFTERKGGSGPKYRALQAALVDKQLPDVYRIHAALLEQWAAVRDELGTDAASFFQAPKREAGRHLYDLAETLYAALEADEAFYKEAVLQRLDGIEQALAASTPSVSRTTHGSHVEGDVTGSTVVTGNDNKVVSNSPGASIGGQHIHNHGKVGEQVNVAGDGVFHFGSRRKKD